MTALAPTPYEVDYDTREELQRLRRDGSLVAMKAGMILEEFGLPDSAKALLDKTVTQETKERVKQTLMKLAGYDQPRLNAGANQGFSITINLDNRSQTLGIPPPQVRLDAVAPEPPATASIPHTTRFGVVDNSDLRAGLD